MSIERRRLKDNFLDRLDEMERRIDNLERVLGVTSEQPYASRLILIDTATGEYWELTAESQYVNLPDGSRVLVPRPVFEELLELPTS